MDALSFEDGQDIVVSVRITPSPPWEISVRYQVTMGGIIFDSGNASFPENALLNAGDIQPIISDVLCTVISPPRVDFVFRSFLKRQRNL